MKKRVSYSLATTLLACLLLLSSCSIEDPKAPQPVCQIVPPVPFDFGDVVLGRSKTQTFTLTNIGGEFITGSISGCSGFSVENAPGSIRLGAGESAKFDVVFTPAGSFASSCCLTVGTCEDVCVQGSGVPFEISTFPESTQTYCGFTNQGVGWNGTASIGAGQSITFDESTIIDHVSVYLTAGFRTGSSGPNQSATLTLVWFLSGEEFTPSSLNRSLSASFDGGWVDYNETIPVPAGTHIFAVFVSKAWENKLYTTICSNSSNLYGAGRSYYARATTSSDWTFTYRPNWELGSSTWDFPFRILGRLD